MTSGDIMKKMNVTVAVNMDDYKNKIAGFDFEQLEAEKQKIRKNMNVPYIHLQIGSDAKTHIVYENLNIADDKDERERILLRKKVAVISSVISGQLNKFTTDFASNWNYINTEFLKSTSDPSYVSARLQGKSVPFANKLSLLGLKAYKKYLILLSDCIGKMPHFNMAVHQALFLETKMDQEVGRFGFYTRYFLPNNIDSIYKNLVREKIINATMKQFGDVKKTNESGPEPEKIIK